MAWAVTRSQTWSAFAILCATSVVLLLLSPDRPLSAVQLQSSLIEGDGPWPCTDPAFEDCGEYFAHQTVEQCDKIRQNKCLCTGLKNVKQSCFKLNTPKAPRSASAGLQRVSRAVSTLCIPQAQGDASDQNAFTTISQADVDRAALLDKFFERPLRLSESDHALSLSQHQWKRFSEHIGDFLAIQASPLKACCRLLVQMRLFLFITIGYMCAGCAEAGLCMDK